MPISPNNSLGKRQGVRPSESRGPFSAWTQTTPHGILWLPTARCGIPAPPPTRLGLALQLPALGQALEECNKLNPPVPRTSLP